MTIPSITRAQPAKARFDMPWINTPVRRPEVMQIERDAPGELGTVQCQH